MYERDEFLRDRIDHQPGTPRDTRPVRRPEIAAPRHRLAGTLLPLRHQGRRACLQLHCVHCRTRLGHASRRPATEHLGRPALAPIRSRTRPGERGWRRMVRLVTFGLVGLGRSGMQRQEAQFEATIRTVLHGNHKVAVLGKGGVERRRLRRASDRSLPNCASRTVSSGSTPTPPSAG